MEEARQWIRFRFPVLSFAPIVPVSAREGARIDKLLETTEKVLGQLNRRVETAELNQAMNDWFAFNPIPPVKGRNYKARYITQVSSHPVRFLLFVNRKKGFPEAYLRFIINNIRKNFGFSSIPISMEVRERK
jgi:GTP-binding protein